MSSMNTCFNPLNLGLVCYTAIASWYTAFNHTCCVFLVYSCLLTMRIPSWQEPCLTLTPALGPVLGTWEMLNMCLLDWNCWLKVYIKFLMAEFQASGFWMDYPAIPRITPWIQLPSPPTSQTCLLARTLTSYRQFFPRVAFLTGEITLCHRNSLLNICKLLLWE